MQKLYSQNREEAWLSDYFGDETGTFLDIGANDGKTISNTYRLALNGWSGVYVEPSPRAFARLQANVSALPNPERFKLLNYALGYRNTTLTLYESGPHKLANGQCDNIALLSTTRETEKNRWVKEAFHPVQVPCRKPQSLPEIWEQRFDFISIDAEGLDYQILTQLDLPRLGVRALIIEWNGEPSRKDDILWYCANNPHRNGKSMQLRRKNFENLFLAI